MNDMVNSPSHYNHGQKECIEQMEESFDANALNGFCLLNAYKYIDRYPYKNKPIEDLQKARWYICRYLHEQRLDAAIDDKQQYLKDILQAIYFTDTPLTKRVLSAVFLEVCNRLIADEQTMKNDNEGVCNDAK